MMHEPIKYGRGKSSVVIKYFEPIFQGAIRGNDDRTSLVALADNLEEEIGASFIDGQITEFVENKQVRF